LDLWFANFHFLINRKYLHWSDDIGDD
jgi:hypothetical protein